MVSKTTFARLSPNRQGVLQELWTIDINDNPWIEQVYDAIEDGFFEKASRILSSVSPDLSKKMLEG